MCMLKKKTGFSELKVRINICTLSPTEVLSCLLVGFTGGLAGLTLKPLLAVGFSSSS